MVHSVKNRKKRERSKQLLKRRVKMLDKLAVNQTKDALEMMLPYVALGDLRRRWRQKSTPLHPDLLKKVDRFKRIKILKDKPLCIRGSDNGLLVYGVALNDKELVDNLFKSVQAAPIPKHYTFRGMKRSDYLSWHWTGWAKYKLEPFMSRNIWTLKRRQQSSSKITKRCFEGCRQY